MKMDGRGAALRNISPETQDFLKKPDDYTPSAFFLGPNGENAETLRALIATAIDGHVGARKDYFGDDPAMATEGQFNDASHKATRDAMQNNIERLTNALRGSIPLSSFRNQSHMYWDLTLAGSAGYFAGMLYNQNNVAAEASPVTTSLEIWVGQDLCQMLGYDTSEEAEIKPFGKLLGGGSLANFEAIWAARNVKYLAAGLARAIREEEDMQPARGVLVTLPNGKQKRLLDLEVWELVNLEVDAALALKEDLTRLEGIPEATVAEMVDKYSLQAIGAVEFNQRILHGAVAPTPAVLVPATAHYSFEKAVTILGLGHKALEFIPVDLEGRMDINKLKATLDRCLEEKRPVLQVVSVMGSTGEGAVDPLEDILELKAKFADLGLTFALHGDAAWGGYFASMLREAAKVNPQVLGASSDEEDTGYDLCPSEPLSDHVRAQFERLADCDTITLDPHKSGYIPYPAGALCYRNEAMVYEIAHTSPVVSHSGDAPTVGTYGIEGSRPGAAACGVALSHVTVPTNMLGYGRLLGRCIFNSKRYYAAVVTMAKPEDEFTVVPFIRLPAEKEGATAQEVADQRAQIEDRFVGISNEVLMERLRGDDDLLDLFQALGPDLTVFSYAFNFSVDGVLNTDIGYFNQFNDALFEAMSLEVKGESGKVPEVPFFVTASAFSPKAHGPDVLKSFRKRAGLEPEPEKPLSYLISTMQNPFLTATERGNFIPDLIEVLRQQVREVRAEFVRKHGLGKEGA